MRILLAYIYVTAGPISNDLAAAFVGTYTAYPPGIAHDTLVICNNGPISEEGGLIFASMPNARFFPRSNEGWDIGAYFAAAKGPASDYDMVLWCGESVYFHRAGWLARFADAWNINGPGMYGPWASHLVRAHLNTTMFACAPSMFSFYPHTVRTRQERYQFEHGDQAFWRRLQARKIPTMLVTWDGCWRPGQWRYPKNILWRGDQSNCLAFCNHTDRWDSASKTTKSRWQAAADSPFK